MRLSPSSTVYVTERYVATTDPASGNWHLDKRIPIALIMAVVVQTIGAVWWAATISAQVEAGSVERARLEERITASERAINLLTTQSARGEERIEQTMRLLERVESKLDELITETRNR